MGQTGLLEVHGDFRHPQTDLNPKPLTRKNQSRSDRIVLGLNFYPLSRRRPATSPASLIPNASVRGAWIFIRPLIQQVKPQALWISWILFLL
jgi:hypothetical protein